MRQAFRSAVVLFVAIVGVVGLAIGSAFSAAFAFGAVGLFVPGTGTPDAGEVADYLTNARDRYTQNTPCSTAENCSPVGVDYPASFFPLAIFPTWCRSGPDGCDKWNVSVGKGTDELDTLLTPYLSESSSEQVTVFGYSQGGAVVANELQRIAALDLDPSVLDRLHVVTIGGIENPDGGLWQRLGFLPTIPFLDISFNPGMKTDNGFDTTAIGFEYDPVTYAPRYWGNALALFNAFAAFETVHGYYLEPTGNDGETMPYGYTPGADGTLAPQLNCETHGSNCRYGSSGETTYVMIPATSLPMYDLIYGLVPAALKPVVKPVINLLTPVTELVINLAYDWSGDPDKPTPLSILPFNPFKFNPIDFSVKFVAAVGQGIQDAINGGPALPATNTTPVSTVALRSIDPQTAVEDLPVSTDGQAKVTALSSKKLATDVTDTTAAKGKDLVTTTPDETTPEQTTQQASGESSSQVESTVDETKKDEINKDEINKDEIDKDEAKKDEPKKDDVKKVHVKKDDVKKVHVTKDHVTKDHVTKDAGDAGSDASKKDAA